MDKIDQDKDKFLKDIMAEAGIDFIGEGFTDQVMERIEKTEAVYEPLPQSKIISTSGWIIIAMVSIALFGLTFFLGTPSNVFEDLSPFFNSIRFEIPHIQIPRVYWLGIIGFLIFFFIQIRIYSRTLLR